ncbi:MAG: enolase C-terminal domain-like protein [Planctomycetota bacterium]
MGKPTDIRIKEVRMAHINYRYRTPIKFGGTALDRVTNLDVAVYVESPSGKTAVGFGSMPLNNIWAFPSKTVPFEQTLEAMKALSRRIAKILPGASGGEYLHPLDHSHVLEPLIFAEAKEADRELKLSAPIPPLASLVTASPFDAAIHDAFGKIHGINSYHSYGAKYVSHDLSHYLDKGFTGEYLDRYVSKAPKKIMPIYHLVGALDPLTDGDLKTRVNDGLPETLYEWVLADGLTHLKIKLNGDDLDWDVARVLAVNAVCDQVEKEHGPRAWQQSLDFNERCANVQYLLDFLMRVKKKSPKAFDRAQYIEQPTARDLRANPENKMHAATKFKPVVIDESLLDYESLILSAELGYSGVALKACKGQSQAVLMGAAAQKRRMFLCVQDLTCTDASFLHSAGLAARIPTVAAIEGNGRQYCPAANKGWEDRFPTVFKVKNGRIETGVLTGMGLGCAPVGYEGVGLKKA